MVGIGTGTVVLEFVGKQVGVFVFEEGCVEDVEDFVAGSVRERWI